MVSIKKLPWWVPRVNTDKQHDTYMKMAEVLAQRSHATIRKVGCIIVKDDQIIAEGFNGTPKGFDNNCEEVDFFGWLKTLPHVLHAESNSITKLAKSTQSSQGASLYTTAAPCHDCAKLIIQAEIAEVFYLDSYRNTLGLDLLQKAGIPAYEVTYD